MSTVCCHDRNDAGRRLAAVLAEFRRPRAVILGIPRGGVVVAAEVARMLEAELDVVVAKKLGAPGHQELASGAIAVDGRHYLNEALICSLRVSGSYLPAAAAAST